MLPFDPDGKAFVGGVEGWWNEKSERRQDPDDSPGKRHAMPDLTYLTDTT